ncbi:uncharacterized protein TNCV_4411091 [Trichonephila clavipes]|nr:uncharacterized protein TNCV_4411091 [Trichonephila clavipes]
MDQIDAFPEHISTTVMPVTLPEKPDALEYAARPGHVRACIIYQEPNTKRVFVLFCKDNWYQKKTLLYNFKHAILEAKHVNEFRPDDVLWEKISKGLLRNPDRPLKNTDKRMVDIYNNMFFVKKDFTFGFRTTKETLRSKGLRSTTSDTGSCTRRDKQKAFGATSRAFFQKVVIAPVIRPPVAPVLIARPFTALSTLQPVSIPEPPKLTTSQPPELTTSQILLQDPPEQTTPQILLPDPPSK